MVEEQEEHVDRVGVGGFAKGMVRADEDEDGWDDRRVCEYRQTGHLEDDYEDRSIDDAWNLPTVPPFA